VDRAPVIVGIFGKVRGLAGECRLRSTTDFPERYLRPGSFLLKRGDDLLSVRLESARWHRDDVWLVRLEGYGVDEAERLSGAALALPAERRVKPPRGTFYVSDLVGFAVRTPGGRDLGVVAGAEQYPAGDCLLVRRPDGRETLILFARDRVKVDVKARVVTALPEGLDPEEFPEAGET